MKKELVYDDLIEKVCVRLGITKDQLLSRSRERNYVYGRCIVARILKEDFKLSYKKTGRILFRDHSTVINMIRTHENLIDTGDEPYTAMFKSVKYEILDKENISNEMLKIEEILNKIKGLLGL